jgi:hypothetical protein
MEATHTLDYAWNGNSLGASPANQRVIDINIHDHSD